MKDYAITRETSLCDSFRRYYLRSSWDVVDARRVYDEHRFENKNISTSGSKGPEIGDCCLDDFAQSYTIAS